ncbi:MAG TPA: YetF domain-containing protein [Gammaproteobacteria bacterium]|nr:YetF domain-containing protein [Gammaproteobacteria bacterium]
MNQMLFSGWDGLLRIVVVGVPAYVMLVVFLRVAGKRTLSKMNAFDLVVTVALGSTLATALLAKDVALAEVAFAFALLISLQFAVTWSSVRARWVRRMATGEPLMLLYCGEFLPAALRQARVTEDEVRAAVRSAGVASLDNVRAVVLETDGSFSVVRPGEGGNGSSLDGVDGPQELREPASGR